MKTVKTKKRESRSAINVLLLENIHESAKDSFQNKGYSVRALSQSIETSVLAENIGMEVYYYDIADKLSLGNAKKCRSLSELLKKVHVLSVNVDGRAENKNLIGSREFRAMKEGAYVLNLSRGFVIDLNALADALKRGKLRGAALDVFPQEPKSNVEKFHSVLQHMPNVILTPHIGGSTEEAQQNIAQYVPSRIIDYLAHGDTMMSVNFPHLQLSPLMRGHRLAHIHKNLPGLLANINSVLAKRMINITGQYLKTDERIGYVITDFNKKSDEALLADLQKIDHTIKVRIFY